MDYDYIRLKEKSEQEFHRWLDNTETDNAFHKQLLQLYGNDDELIDSFYTDLEFGASGLRGLLGPGTNRMNAYVVRRATQGVANYLKKKSTGISPRLSVVISYDSREGSELFAREAAAVFNANGVETYLFKRLSPVSVLSYAIRYLKCDMGIMITASHNPRMYNGYKVYNKEGFQIVGQEPEQIQEEIDALDYFEGIASRFDDDIMSVPNEVSRNFIKHITTVMPNIGTDILNDLKTIYTPLNGAGGVYVRELFRSAGYANYNIVKVQELPDPGFKTCPVPNPERILAYDEAFKTMDEAGGDIIIATDPDADRAGAALYHDGMRTLVTGNQLGILMIDYLCHFRPPQEGQLVFKSIASTPMVNMLARKYGFKVVNTLTGFRYIGELIAKLDAEDKKSLYYFGFEESNSFLMDPFIRDKDGISTSLLIVQMAAYHKSQGKDLVDRLREIYDELGPCIDKNRNYMFRGPRGRDSMNKIMDFFRYKIDDFFADRRIAKKIDYKRYTGLPKANVIELDFDDGSRMIIRPSSTEAKLKIYTFETGDFTEVEREIVRIIEHFR